MGMGLEGAPEAAILGAARANGPGGRAECESSTSTPAGNRAVSASCSDWNGYGDGLCHQPGRHARVSAPRLRMATPPGRTGCTHEVIRAIVLDCSPYLLTLQGGGLAGLKRRRVGAADRIEHLFDALLSPGGIDLSASGEDRKAWLAEEPAADLQHRKA